MSHAKDNVSTTFSETYNSFNLGLLDPYNPELDFGDADYDVRHRVSLSGIWEIPFGRNSSGGMKQVVSGWQMAVLFSAQTGAPFTVFDCSNGGATGRCLFGCRMLGISPPKGRATRFDRRPQQLRLSGLEQPAVRRRLVRDPITGTSAFGPVPGEYDRRNIFRAPGGWNTMRCSPERFRFSGNHAFQFRWEVYNLFAHANQYVNIGSADISSGPIITSFFGDTGSNDGAPAGDGQRRMQVGLRYEF